jgi:Protein of unknown function (DUF3489)
VTAVAAAANHKETEMPNPEILEITRTCEGFNPDTPKSKPAKTTKAGKLLKLLKSKRGATIAQLQEASGWQSHSVRGFLSGTVKKKLGLTLIAEPGKDGYKRYHIDNETAGE